MNSESGSRPSSDCNEAGLMEAAVWHIDNLNCHQAHLLEMRSGDQLRHGWARGPDGNLYRHTWILRDGEILDLFHWTDHKDEGRRFVQGVPND